ncbi:transcriptional regulator [Lichenibacterium minor]|uniref:Transcriptional regulator n=2 Tax=Lichenibacterium minor TaxID=2316528 RepID=A0A4Q2U0R3_9HYPH|nr:transcriptional regulator [Lichenibacterium minor]
MEQADLARDAGVALGLVVRIEAVDGMAMMRKPDGVAIRSVLEAAGVDFIPENCGGAGVRLRKAGASE